MCRIICDSVNPVAVKLYKSLGFTEYQVQRCEQLTKNFPEIRFDMNLLVTAIGSFSADCVINSLRKVGHTVVGCDIYPPEWHAVSKDCNWVYQGPIRYERK